MAIDGFDFNTISAAQTDPDSPVDTILMTGFRDNHEFVMRWLGKSFLGGAVADHNHDGVNSAKVTTADLTGDAGDVPGFDAAVQAVAGFGGGSLATTIASGTTSDGVVTAHTINITLANIAESDSDTFIVVYATIERDVDNLFNNVTFEISKPTGSLVFHIIMRSVNDLSPTFSNPVDQASGTSPSVSTTVSHLVTVTVVRNGDSDLDIDFALAAVNINTAHRSTVRRV